MKILYVITSLSVGGAENALAELALYCKQAHTVKVVCLNPIGAVGRRLAEERVDVVSLNAGKIPTWRQVSQLRDWIRSFQPDIVHAMLFRAVELCRVLRWTLPFTLISTLHFDLSKKNLLLRALDRLLCRGDALTVAESLSTGSYLVQTQKYPKNKVYLLPNGVNRAVYVKNVKSREKIREIFNIKSEDTVFVCVARLSREKNHLLLLESFRDVLKTNKNVKLLLVGDGLEKTNLEAFCDLNQMAEFVIFAGRQNHVADYLNAGDVFVLPSQIESLPLALLEAVSVGLPAIVSKVGDMPLVVTHGKNGFVFPPGDVTLLSCFMRELVDNVTLRQQMSEAALEAAALRVLEVGPEYEKIYNEVLK